MDSLTAVQFYIGRGSCAYMFLQGPLQQFFCGMAASKIIQDDFPFQHVSSQKFAKGCFTPPDLPFDLASSLFAFPHTLGRVKLNRNIIKTPIIIMFSEKEVIYLKSWSVSFQFSLPFGNHLTLCWGSPVIAGLFFMVVWQAQIGSKWSIPRKQREFHFWVVDEGNQNIIRV